MKAAIGGQRYDTAHMDILWSSGRDGAGVGREAKIYITPKGRKLVRVNITHWQGEQDSMELLTLSELMEQYPDCAEWLPDDILATIPAAE